MEDIRTMYGTVLVLKLVIISKNERIFLFLTGWKVESSLMTKKFF